MIINIVHRFYPKASASITEANIRYLYLEIFWAAILGAIASFNSLYAVRLGASTALIGLLTSLPALLQAILSIPSARFLESRRERKKWLLQSLLLMRVGHLGMVVLPIVFPFNNPYPLTEAHTLNQYLNAIRPVQNVTAIWLTVWILALVIPNSFFVNGFNAMLAEIVPERQRAFVFSRRTIIWSLLVTFITAGVGFYLDRTAGLFPHNYQLMYLFGVITVFGSQHYLWKLVVAQVSEASRIDLPKKPVVKTPLSRPMKNYLMNVFVYQMGINLPGSLFIIHYANELKVSDGLISVNTAAGTFAFVIGLFIWELLIRKRGFFWSMRVATCMTWIFPFIVGVTGNFAIIIIGNILVNLCHPGMELSIVNVIFKLCRPEQRNMNMSYYTTVVNIAVFASPLIAVPLSAWIGIPGVMLIAASLRLFGGVLFNINKVRAEAAPSAILQTAA